MKVVHTTARLLMILAVALLVVPAAGAVGIATEVGGAAAFVFVVALVWLVGRGVVRYLSRRRALTRLYPPKQTSRKRRLEGDL